MRTPLTAVLGYVTFALADTDKTDERHRMLDVVVGEDQHRAK